MQRSKSRESSKTPAPSWAGSLAGRLALLLAGFVVLVTVVVVLREYAVGEDRLVAETYRTLSARAQVAADRLSVALAERQRLVTVWAGLETSQDLAVDDVDKRVSLSLADLASTLGAGTEAVAARSGGPVLSASDPARLEAPGAPLPPFAEEALLRPEAGARLVPGGEGGVVVTSADVTSLVDGGPLGRIVVWTPLSSFLAAAIPLELDRTELTAAHGVVLARGGGLEGPDDAFLWVRDTARTVAGPVGVGVARPRGEVTAALRASGRQLVTLALAFLLLALPAAVLVARSATSGLRRLTRAARELDARRPAPLPPVSPWAPGEVRVLREAMASMVDRLEAAREELARNESLAAVGVLTKSLAHEIRTPLSVLKAGTEMLLRSPQAGPREREVSEMLQAEVARLARLVDDLLVFGRPSPPRPGETELGEVASSVLRALEGEAREKGVALRREGGAASAWADPDQLRQIVVNLVTNAVRACPDGGTVVVRTLENDGDGILEVEDDGVGVPPDRMEEIWQPLVTTHRSGTGLGLPIVKQLVEAHGGSVQMKSVPGEGTRVRVTLPGVPDTEKA